MKNIIMIIAASVLLIGCSATRQQFEKTHEDVFGCPPLENQVGFKHRNNPDIEKILDLPKCDNPKAVYPEGAAQNGWSDLKCFLWKIWKL